MKTRYYLLLPFLILSLGFVGCNSDDDDDNPTPIDVTSADIVLSQQSADIKVANQGSIDISDGNGEYKVFSLDETIATATVSGNKIAIQGVAMGKTTIVVSDKEMKLKSIPVSVYQYEKVIVDKESIELVGKLGNLMEVNVTLLEGNGSYTIKTSDNTIATAAFVTDSIMKVTMPAGKEGDATITLTDVTGRKVEVLVKITLTNKPYGANELESIVSISELIFQFRSATKKNLTNVNYHTYYNTVDGNMKMYGWKYYSQYLNVYFPAADNTVGVKTGAKVAYYNNTWGGGTSGGETLDLIHFEIIKNDGIHIWAVFSLIQDNKLHPGCFIQKINP